MYLQFMYIISENSDCSSKLHSSTREYKLHRQERLHPSEKLQGSDCTTAERLWGCRIASHLTMDLSPDLTLDKTKPACGLLEESLVDEGTAGPAMGSVAESGLLASGVGLSSCAGRVSPEAGLLPGLSWPTGLPNCLLGSSGAL